MSNWPYGEDEMLTPGQVAEEFKVDPKTVTRWAQSGRIPDYNGHRSVIRTPGGHRRIRADVVRAILVGEIEMTYPGIVHETEAS